MKRNPNGQGNFTILDNNKVRMRKQCGYQANGRPKILTVTADSKSACIRAMKIKENEWEKEQNINQVIIRETLPELCYRHLEADIKMKKSFKPLAIDRRECTIRNQIENKKYAISRLQVQAITTSDISEHIYGLIVENKLSASSIRKAFDVINAAYKWSIKMGYITKNPCDPIVDELTAEFRTLEAIEDSNKKRVKALSESQIQVFEETCRTRNKNDGKYKYSAALSALFLLYTGLRCGELCALRYGDIERAGEKIIISINKTRSVIINRKEDAEQKYVEYEGNTKNVKCRNLDLNDKAASVLEEILASRPFKDADDYIVLNESHKPTDPRKLGVCINTIYRNAKLPKDISGAHVLRKTYATQRYKKGGDVNLIAAYLGDLPSTVWEHYISSQDSIDAGEEKGVINYVPAN